MQATEETTDAELVARARRGEAASFAALVRRHERTMLALAYACTKCPATAADVVQDAVVRCWRKLADLREEHRFAAWLATTVRHLSVNALRSPHRRRMRLVGDEMLDQTAVADATTDVADRDHAASIRAAVDGLDEASASVLVLRYYEGLSSKAIADVLDVSPAAVDMRLTRARQALKARLVQDGLVDAVR